MSRDCGSEAFGCNQSVVDLIKYHQDLSMISYCVYYDTVVKLNFISYIHRGLRECFEKDYEHLFDVPPQLRTDNDVSGLSPIYIPAAGR